MTFAKPSLIIVSRLFEVSLTLIISNQQQTNLSILQNKYGTGILPDSFTRAEAVINALPLVFLIPKSLSLQLP